MNTYFYEAKDAHDKLLYAGTIHASSMDEAAESLTKRKNIKAVVKDETDVTFKRDGKLVRFYLYIVPRMTEVGRNAIAKWKEKEAKRIEKEREENERINNELTSLIEKYGGIQNVIDKLKQE
jgi:hypothetical protein